MTKPEIRSVQSMNGSSFGLLFSFELRHSAFLLRTVALYRNWFPELVDSDESKDAMCDAALLAGHVTRYPYFYRYRH
jgi:hypothetical protein